MDRFVSRSSRPETTKLPLRDADVVLRTQVWAPAKAAAIAVELANLPQWAARDVVVAGRRCTQNRLTCFFAADPGLSYRHSGTENDNAEPFPPVVREVCDVVEKVLGMKFNYALLNQYPDGRSTLGWHADDERDLVRGSVIASCSFGVPRDFEFRRRDAHGEKHRVALASGSLLTMGGRTQKTHHHRVAPNARVSEPRYNITFRKVGCG